MSDRVLRAGLSGEWRVEDDGLSKTEGVSCPPFEKLPSKNVYARKTLDRVIGNLYSKEELCDTDSDCILKCLFAH
ncbi:protein of unknown function [Kyrpidia spormannii]|uniref:Uncharacterized protein n=1 Tax=Kyrpidia spormannii TaxID=2055160 RepID=A0A6F9EIJ0_9BACL|nr:protein of unknown function [Kyrpidia spormannii]